MCVASGLTIEAKILVFGIVQNYPSADTSYEPDVGTPHRVKSSPRINTAPSQPAPINSASLPSLPKYGTYCMVSLLERTGFGRSASENGPISAVVRSSGGSIVS